MKHENLKRIGQCYCGAPEGKYGISVTQRTWDPCMVYLPTFTLQTQREVSTIHRSDIEDIEGSTGALGCLCIPLEVLVKGLQVGL